MSVYTLIKVVSYYDLSVLSMSVMGFKKKSGWVGLSKFFFGFLEFYYHVHVISAFKKRQGVTKNGQGAARCKNYLGRTLGGYPKKACPQQLLQTQIVIEHESINTTVIKITVMCFFP